MSPDFDRPSLTNRQREILEFILASVQDRGNAPTVREIAAAFHFASPRAASDHLQSLENKGYIRRHKGCSRGIELLIPNRGIPIIGQVAAGSPISAIENWEGDLAVETHFGAGELFAVRVKGDSMRDAGILEGDCVIVKRQPHIEQGMIGVAYINGEATVKRLYRMADGFKLEPANPSYAPLLITSDMPDFQIAGPVVGLIRKLPR